MAVKVAVGDLSPDISGETQEGHIDLADFRGAKSVVLWAYPKDLTPG
jgi:peroxiredoxin Q/BCP